MFKQAIYPFAAIVGQEEVKQAVLAALVNPQVGGLLIGGRKGTAKTTLVRSAQALLPNQEIINLPLNVTEDMLFGSIDIEQAVSKGERKFLLGIMNRADGQFIYIDEANLLRQELLLAVLDTNEAGFNHVERDGISYEQAVQYTVLATMNPEEGTLSQPILDRFGMYVDVQNEERLEQRVEIIKRNIAFSRDMEHFQAVYAQANAALALKIAQARKLLPTIEFTAAMIKLAAQMCAQAFCAGHRAELYLLETARALAALAGRNYLLPQDMDRAAVYVLPHRMRIPPEQEENNPNQEQEEDTDSEVKEEQDNDSADSAEHVTPPQSPDTEDAPPDAEGQQDGDNDIQPQQEPDKQQTAPEEELAAIDRKFVLPKIVVEMGKNNLKRRGSGKRSITRTDLKQGRYVRAELPKGKVEDLAFDATIRAAAPYQVLRVANDCALNIHKDDLRQKVREKRIGNTFLFAVDASGSMGARKRMGAVKGAIFYMLQDAYQKRDRVGMLAFRRDRAEVLLPITRSVDLAQKCLAEMSTGGKTPLADALAVSLQLLTRMNKQDSEMEPILVLVTDGRANAVEADGGDPVAAAVKMAERLRRAAITSVVIDTESDFIKLGIAKKIAQAMGASYYSLQKLSKEQILHIVRQIEK